MNVRHRWHDLLDFADRHAAYIAIAMLVGLLVIGGTCAGTPDDGRGYLTPIEDGER